MKDRDELDRLLTALGNAAPDAGFEQRVLRGIERRRLRSAQQRSPRKFLALGLASALAMVVACAGIAVFHRGPEASPVARRPANQTLPTPAQAAQEVRLAANFRPKLSVAQQKAPPSDPGMLVSFPAPPAPLTEQERLLLRVAQGHNPVEEAMLKTDALTLEEARAQDEFQRFFPPPDPPANDVPTAQPPDPGASPNLASPTASTKKDNQGDPK